MACPFFMPAQKLEGTWLHPSRLPLGGGWDGYCSAPGHEGDHPTLNELHEFCNLGYADCCPRLPARRDYDAIRFSVARDFGSRLLLMFVCETGHRPATHGTLEYDLDRADWTSTHPDSRIQKMAECYLQAYLQRRIPSATADPISSAHS